MRLRHIPSQGASLATFDQEARAQERHLKLVLRAPQLKHTIAVLIIAACAIAGFAGAAIFGSNRPSDFAAFYTAGKLVLAGRGPSLYNWQVQRQLESMWTPLNFLRPYHRPAWHALLFTPFAFLPYRAAYITWWAINLFVMGIVLYLLRRQLRSIGLGGRILFLGAIFVPFDFTLNEGTDVILLALVMVLASQSLEQRREMRAGVLLALATIKFHLLLPLFAVLVIRGRRRVLAGLGLTGAGLVASCFLVAGHGFVRDYTAMIRHTHAVTDPLSYRMGFSLYSFLYPWSTISLIVSVTVVLGALWLFANGDRGGLEFGALWIIGVITAYHSGIVDLLPGLCVVLPDLLSSGARDPSCARSNAGKKTAIVSLSPTA